MKDLLHLIQDVPDFPKKGIVFKDITPLLKDHSAVNTCLEYFIKALEGVKIDKVVGIESRGFLFGMLLAQRLGVGFVPIRKPGKLPGKVLSENYNLEYGTDALEIHENAIAPGEKVLIHDDVLATGGTAKAACNLVERLNAEVVAVNFLIELTFLDGAKQLSPYSSHSIFRF
ncbi:adenine phosphoribosyltransferase [Aurantibacter aestuarii]|uniref:Adenine phosphoribosyltransferase n=1 Tax=Aurantibacter aestuarii TaxID=1266046 RepID=A0A2T1NA69_9FLAO|nr:adenine phosphoribosyltransferase [Aurantibacter aestuarii]PSG88733.1 adenine phosphoribosyltransferase [Aurantibacter aestuarii]